MENFLIMENALSDEDLKIALEEIKLHENDFKFEEIRSDTFMPDTIAANFTRWYPTTDNILSKMIDKLLYGERIRKKVERFEDISWQLLCSERLLSYEVQVTKYLPNTSNQYLWHVDHMGPEPRLMNYILYLSEPEEGGELQIDTTNIQFLDEHEPDIRVKPEVNKLTIMPAHYPHRVTPTKGNVPRLTINGHISYT